MTAESLNAALLELQANLPTVAKRQVANTGSYSYKYAGLSSVMSALLPRLNKLGVIFISRPTLADGRPVLTCELVHVATGEKLTAEYPITAAANAPAQAIGSSISYGRRYCLTAMCGLVAEDDDDGRAATARYDDERPARQPRERQVRNGDDELADEPLLRGMFADLNRAGYKDKEASVGFITSVIGRPIESRKELRRGEVAAVRNALREGERGNHEEDPEGNTA